MNRDDMDDDLRQRFARLREDERARASSFLRVRARTGQTRPRRWTLSIPGVMAAAAVVAFAFVTVTSLSDRRGGASVGRDSMTALGVLPVGSWDAPTDFLLDTPETPLLNSVPSIGRTSGWGLTGADAKGARPIATDSQGRAPS